MAAVIGESASSLLKIIDDILDFSKIEAGKLEVEQVPLALLTLVEGVAETLAAAARKKALAMVTFFAIIIAGTKAHGFVKHWKNLVPGGVSPALASCSTSSAVPLT